MFVTVVLMLQQAIAKKSKPQETRMKNVI